MKEKKRIEEIISEIESALNDNDLVAVIRNRLIKALREEKEILDEINNKNGKLNSDSENAL